MTRKYKSKTFQKLYNNFAQMFEQEGNCYESILESVQEDYEHGKLPNGTSKMLIINVLKDVTVDYYKSKVRVLTEKEYLEK